MPGSQCRTEVPHSSFSPKISLRRLERSMGGCTPAVEPPPCTPPLPFVQGTGSPGSRSIEQSQGRCGGNWRLSASKKAEVMILRRDVLTLSMGLSTVVAWRGISQVVVGDLRDDLAGRQVTSLVPQHRVGVWSKNCISSLCKIPTLS